MSKSQQEPSIEVPLEIIKQLLTSSESRMLKQRYLIIRLRQQGLTIRAIAKKLTVGSDTVVRVLKKIKVKPQIKKSQSAKWVFGQISGEKEKN